MSQSQLTWPGGPLHQIQKQHIPGYKGFVPGLISSNQNGKSFARTTAESIRNSAGTAEKPSEPAYQTTYAQDFNAKAKTPQNELDYKIA